MEIIHEHTFESQCAHALSYKNCYVIQTDIHLVGVPKLTLHIHLNGLLLRLNIQLHWIVMGWLILHNLFWTLEVRVLPSMDNTLTVSHCHINYTVSDGARKQLKTTQSNRKNPRGKLSLILLQLQSNNTNVPVLRENYLHEWVRHCYWTYNQFQQTVFEKVSRSSTALCDDLWHSDAWPTPQNISQPSSLSTLFFGKLMENFTKENLLISL